jgi:L-serine dehydratase
MALSALDLYSIGIGPSSSHTVGPMRAARTFALGLRDGGAIGDVRRLRAEMFGSLGLTGRGHGTPGAVMLGLEGHDPATVDTGKTRERLAEIRDDGRLVLAGVAPVPFEPDRDVVLHRKRSLPAHPNGMIFSAESAAGALVAQRTFYSVGGGFVVNADADGTPQLVPDDTAVTYPFGSAAELLAHCERTGGSIAEVIAANEECWRPAAETRETLLHTWAVMQECVANGCRRDGLLPGGLKVPRRAPALHERLVAGDGPAAGDGRDDPLWAMDWVNLYALAVNEENASGGRVVTAPTNGAAGIIPAVLHYYAHFIEGASDDGIVCFLLTAAAVGMLIKQNASISGAEIGCQGEVGSACAMAAAGLCAVLGGTPEQVENAAEVGIEHNLGLTCDPVGGLVQIPCIERNAIGAVKAINAARLARHGTGSHRVSLDKAIKTMRDTGRDMKDKYKETARGGLAVNIVEC